MNRTTLLLSSLSLIAFTQGCAFATMPKTGVPANGEPLAVREKTVHQVYEYKEKVGEVEHRSSDGRVVGTSNVYQNKTGVHSYQVWESYQGNAPIDDEDLYRIGGEKQTADEIHDGRDTGVTVNRVGLVVFGAGILSSLAGVLLRSDNPTPLANGLLYGGLGAMVVGGITTTVGAAKTNATHPIDDQIRAANVAEKYNQRLARGEVTVPSLTGATVPGVSAAVGRSPVTPPPPVAAPRAPTASHEFGTEHVMDPAGFELDLPASAKSSRTIEGNRTSYVIDANSAVEVQRTKRSIDHMLFGLGPRVGDPVGAMGTGKLYLRKYKGPQGLTRDYHFLTHGWEVRCSGSPEWDATLRTACASFRSRR